MRITDGNKACQSNTPVVKHTHDEKQYRPTSMLMKYSSGDAYGQARRILEKGQHSEGEAQTLLKICRHLRYAKATPQW